MRARIVIALVGIEGDRCSSRTNVYERWQCNQNAVVNGVQDGDLQERVGRGGCR